MIADVERIVGRSVVDSNTSGGTMRLTINAEELCASVLHTGRTPLLLFQYHPLITITFLKLNTYSDPLSNIPLLLSSSHPALFSHPPPSPTPLSLSLSLRLRQFFL